MNVPGICFLPYTLLRACWDGEVSVPALPHQQLPFPLSSQSSVQAAAQPPPAEQVCVDSSPTTSANLCCPRSSDVVNACGHCVTGLSVDYGVGVGTLVG